MTDEARRAVIRARKLVRRARKQVDWVGVPEISDTLAWLDKRMLEVIQANGELEQ